VSEQIQPIAGETYQEIGIRSHCKGIFYKEPVDGTKLGDKRVFKIVPDCLILNIVFAWEQAVARTTAAEIGMIASHRFPQFRPIANRCDVDYVLYVFKTSYGKDLLATASPGGAGRNKTLGQKEFAKLKLLLPPIDEQVKISRILATWDRAIDTAEQLLRNLQQQKKALMQRLLSPSGNGNKRTNSWECTTLSHLCDIRRGASPRPIEDPVWFAESGRAWIRIADVTASPSRFLMQSTQYLSQKGVEKSVPVDPGDLIMTICATIGVPKIVGIPACIHDGFVLLRPKTKELSVHFLYHFLKFSTARLASGGQPGTQKNLNSSIVGTIQVPLLPHAEQEHIASILTTADDEILNHQKQVAFLRAEKQQLMRQLLTGKRRVKTIEMAAIP
jgi:type I restriction enzyme S subunit